MGNNVFRGRKGCRSSMEDDAEEDDCSMPFQGISINNKPVVRATSKNADISLLVFRRWWLFPLAAEAVEEAVVSWEEQQASRLALLAISMVASE